MLKSFSSLQVQLIQKLRSLLNDYDECQKRAQTEELRRQRLAYVNVSLSNVISDGKKKKRRHRDGEEDDMDDESDSGSDSDSEVQPPEHSSFYFIYFTVWYLKFDA